MKRLLAIIIILSCMATYAFGFNGFINKGFVTTVSSSSNSFLLLENGSFLLLEDGSKLILE